MQAQLRQRESNSSWLQSKYYESFFKRWIELKCEGQVISYHQIITYRIKLMHINNKGVSPLNSNGWSLTWPLCHSPKSQCAPHSETHCIGVFALHLDNNAAHSASLQLTTYSALIHKPEEITFRSSVCLIIVKNYLILI
jgi:hypothetical protein